MSHLMQLSAVACLTISVSGALAERETTAQGEVSRLGDVAPAFDLSGRWVLTLPAGWQRKIVIEKTSDDTFAVEGVEALVLNGVYEIDLAEDRLRMLEANNPEQTEYVWRILNANTLELVQNGGPNRGSYVGATLSRHFEWEELVENSRVPRVGENSPRPGRSVTVRNSPR